MGGTMPFAFQKGSWKYFEDLFNSLLPQSIPLVDPTSNPPVTAIEVLKRQRLQTLVTMYRTGSIFGPNFPEPANTGLNAFDPAHPGRTMTTHAQDDWLGYDSSGNPAINSYRDRQIAANVPMSKWVSYWGDVENILRITFMTALCVSLGIEGDSKFTTFKYPDYRNNDVDIPFDQLGLCTRNTDPLKPPFDTADDQQWKVDNVDLTKLRCWPIEIYHVCGIPWLSGFVAWRNLEATGNVWGCGPASPSPSGYVVVTIVGPSQVDDYAGLSGGVTIRPPQLPQTVNDKTSDFSSHGIPTYSADITGSDRIAGVCVVTHNAHFISVPANTVDAFQGAEEQIQRLLGSDQTEVNNRWDVPLPVYHPMYADEPKEAPTRRSLIGVGPVNLPKFDGGIQ